MFRITSIVAAAVASVLVFAAPSSGQTSTGSAPHIVVIKLVEQGGSVPYAFSPANVQVVRGDTIRFTQAADAPHNVRFTKEPGGAKLGSAATSPYLVSKGQTYDLVIDGRFPDGTYTYVCDPHEMIGMHGSMTVVSTPTAQK